MENIREEVDVNVDQACFETIASNHKAVGVGEEVTLATQVVAESPDAIFVERTTMIQKKVVLNSKTIIPKNRDNLIPLLLNENAQMGIPSVSENGASSEMELGSQDSVGMKMEISSQDSTRESKMDFCSPESTLSPMEISSQESNMDCGSQENIPKSAENSGKRCQAILDEVKRDDLHSNPTNNTSDATKKPKPDLSKSLEKENDDQESAAVVKPGQKRKSVDEKKNDKELAAAVKPGQKRKSVDEKKDDDLETAAAVVKKRKSVDELLLGILSPKKKLSILEESILAREECLDDRETAVLMREHAVMERESAVLNRERLLGQAVINGKPKSKSEEK